MVRKNASIQLLVSNVSVFCSFRWISQTFLYSMSIFRWFISFQLYKKVFFAHIIETCDNSKFNSKKKTKHKKPSQVLNVMNAQNVNDTWFKRRKIR